MTRIVGGLARGRRLTVPPQGTRPTSDRAREALFNTLATMIDLDGARALDLFAGSGAVGLEAVSRGASAVVLVESAAAAVAVIRRNAEVVTGTGAVTVLARPVTAFVAAGPPDEPFDLIFADPPYSLDEAALAPVLATVSDPAWLHADGVLVVERAASADAPPWPDAITAVKRRQYGAGALWYGRRR